MMSAKHSQRPCESFAVSQNAHSFAPGSHLAALWKSRNQHKCDSDSASADVPQQMKHPRQPRRQPCGKRCMLANSLAR